MHSVMKVVLLFEVCDLFYVYEYIISLKHLLKNCFDIKCYVQLYFNHSNCACCLVWNGWFICVLVHCLAMSLNALWWYWRASPSWLTVELGMEGMNNNCSHSTLVYVFAWNERNNMATVVFEKLTSLPKATFSTLGQDVTSIFTQYLVCMNAWSSKCLHFVLTYICQNSPFFQVCLRLFFLGFLTTVQ